MTRQFRPFYLCFNWHIGADLCVAMESNWSMGIKVEMPCSGHTNGDLSLHLGAFAQFWMPCYRKGVIKLERVQSKYSQGRLFPLE